MKDSIAKVLLIFKQKPAFFYIATTGYLLLIAGLKWNIHPTFETLIFLSGGVLGVYFLDIAEVFFNLTPSPFRTILFTAGFALVSFFVVSSSGSRLASGLVLSLYLILILRQIGEWQIRGNLNDWYRMLDLPVPVDRQRIVLGIFVAIFFVETFLLIRS